MVLLMAPLPFTNPVISGNILLMAIGMLEKDGLILCIAYGLAIVITASLMGVGYLLWQAPQLIQPN